MTKSTIRKEVLGQRDIMSPMVKEMLCNTITDNLINLKEFDDSNILFIYSSFRNEVDTIEIIEYCLSRGKKIALPCSYMTNGTPKMEFYYINSRTDLVPGFKGILEPDRRKQHVVKVESLPDVIIVPGVAFDYNLNRIGYGAGFYDAYFKEKGYTDDLTKPYRIGICYDFQMGYDITPDDGDVKMNIVITENGVYR